MTIPERDSRKMREAYKNYITAADNVSTFISGFE